MATPIVLDELDRDGCNLALPENVAVALERTRLVEVRPTGNGHYTLLPRGQVGAVRVNDIQVQVNPKEKVGLAQLIFLLGYATDPGFLPEYVAGVADAELWPALAESLARQAERAVGHGVLQGYTTIEEALRTLRGRIRMSDQMSRRPGQMIPLEVTYDDYSPDTPENRILRSALRRMLRVPGVRPDVRARLAHIDGRLEGVTPLGPREPRPRWTPTRINARYQPALRLSEVVLRHQSAEAGDGGVQVASFVVPMWKVFEDFVTTALGEALRGRPGKTSPQFRGRLDVPMKGVPGRVLMAVDLVHSVAGVPRLIFDSKYKVANSSDRYPNADHYQMLAYCTALDVPRAWLVYAQGGSRPVERLIRNTKISIVEYPLDLRARPRELLAQVDVLAARAWAALAPQLVTAS
jgi:5-methylcytosine-specific restriction enzyme subunit McrC